MNVVGRVSSLISQGVYSVATPFHPFGGAVDIIVVQQQNGSYRSTPWYVRFGKFQGVLKGAEKFVRIEVNGSEANFHMNLDNSGEAYFIKEAPSDKEDEKSGGPDNSDSHEGVRGGNDNEFASEPDSRKDSDRAGHKHSDSGEDELEIRDERVTVGMDRLQRTESDAVMFYDFQDEQFSLDTSGEPSECTSSQCDHLDDTGHVLESHASSEVILVSVDGHILTAPITSAEKNGEILNLDTPQFHLGPGKVSDFRSASKEFSPGDDAWTTEYTGAQNISPNGFTSKDACTLNIDDDNKNSNDGRSLGSRDGRHHVKMQEAQDSVDGPKECANIIMENKSADIRKSEVFRSCLELTELANSIEDGDHFEKDPSADSSKHTPNMKEGFQSSPRGINEDGNGQLPSSSDIYDSVTTPALSVADVSFGKTPLDSDHDISDSISNELDNLDSKTEEHNQMLTEGDNAESEELLVDPKLEEPSDEGEIISGTGFINCENPESQFTPSSEDTADLELELSICKNLLYPGMGSGTAAEVFYANLVSKEEFKLSASSIITNENLVIRCKGKYLPWEKAAPIVLGLAAYGLDLPIDVNDSILVENEMLKTREADSGMSLTPSGRTWRLWSMPFRRRKTLEHTSSISSNEEVFVDSESVSRNPSPEQSPTKSVGDSPRKKYVRTNVPASDQIESLNLKEGQNIVTFIFSTRVLGVQKVDAHIYLWKYNARIVISDVDGTITKSDVLGQFMPLVGKDWTHSGIARLFSAIKENGYQLLFLSARAIVQAYLTRSFLFNLKQVLCLSLHSLSHMHSTA